MVAADTERCTVAQVDHDTPSYACWVDQRPCEVLAPYLPALVAELTVITRHVNGVRVVERVDSTTVATAYSGVLDMATRSLPCGHCRAATVAAEALVGVRLGRQERRVLLLAPGPEDEPAIIPPEADTRAADEAHRRAILTLARQGLVSPREQAAEVRRHDHGMARKRWFENGQLWRYKDPTHGLRVHKRAARLSPLGGVIVGLLRQQLEDGQPIRWGRHRPAILAACRADTSWLRDRFRAALEGRHASLVRMAGAIAILGRATAETWSRPEAIATMLTAIKEPTLTADVKERRLHEKPGCPRCGRHMHGLLQPVGNRGPALCYECWADLGQEWQARQVAADRA